MDLLCVFSVQERSGSSSSGLNAETGEEQLHHLLHSFMSSFSLCFLVLLRCNSLDREQNWISEGKIILIYAFCIFFLNSIATFVH